MNFPAKLSGTAKLVGWLNKLLEAAISARVTSVIGGQLIRGPAGTQLVVNGKDRRVVLVKCCLADGTECFLPVVTAGEPYRTLPETVTAETVTESDAPSGSTVLQ
jgi:hypothetical protein